MPGFAKGIPRLAIVFCAVLGFCLIPPELLDRGPNLCLWSHLFHLTACPSCGSTRALAAFFHGNIRQAMAYNRNVVITAPTLICMLATDILALTRAILHRWPALSRLTADSLGYRPS